MSRRDVSIIIPCFNKVEYTLRCLTSLAEYTPADRYEVVIVDNASTDGTPDLCAQLDGDVVVIRNEVNLGFSKACNQGAAAASGNHLLFLNNDTEALPRWLEPMLAIIESEPDVGAVGSKLLFPDRTVQHAGVIVTELEDGFALAPTHEHYRRPESHPPVNRRRDLEVVTGACVLFRREAFERAGGFDEGYWNGYEDVDLCLQLREAGWRVVFEPASTLIHHESVSGPERFRRNDENVDRLQERWKDRYIPLWLQTEVGAVRAHPGRFRTEIRIQGPAHSSDELDRTIEAALHSCRGRDFVSVDPALAPQLRLGDSRVSVADETISVDYRLDLVVGTTIDRDVLDRLLSMPFDDRAVAAGPVLADGTGPQAIESWLDDVPAPARRAQSLRSLGNVWRRTHRPLDPRCVLRRVGHSPTDPVNIVMRCAYLEVQSTGAVAITG